MNPATQIRVNRILKRCGSTLTPGQLAALSEIVEYELRQQAMDTRQACADLVDQYPVRNHTADDFSLGVHLAILKLDLA